MAKTNNLAIPGGGGPDPLSPPLDPPMKYFVCDSDSTGDSTDQFYRELLYIDTCMRKHGFGNLHIFIPVFAVPIYVI